MRIGALDLGCVFNDAFEFLATDAPLFLTPVASGDPVKFMPMPAAVNVHSVVASSANVSE